MTSLDKYRLDKEKYLAADTEYKIHEIAAASIAKDFTQVCNGDAVMGNNLVIAFNNSPDYKHRFVEVLAKEVEHTKKMREIFLKEQQRIEFMKKFDIPIIIFLTFGFILLIKYFL